MNETIETNKVAVAAETESVGVGVGVGVGGGVGGGVYCAGCRLRIDDRFYLVAVDQAWHSQCLRCGECRRPLDTARSCFARQANIYCKDDYYRYEWVSPTGGS